MVFGLLVLVVGVLLLFQNLGIITGNFWGYFWPILLILLGLTMVIKTSSRKK